MWYGLIEVKAVPIFYCEQTNSLLYSTYLYLIKSYDKGKTWRLFRKWTRTSNQTIPFAFNIPSTDGKLYEFPYDSKNTHLGDSTKLFRIARNEIPLPYGYSSCKLICMYKD